VSLSSEAGLFESPSWPASGRGVVGRESRSESDMVVEMMEQGGGRGGGSSC